MWVDLTKKQYNFLWKLIAPRKSTIPQPRAQNICLTQPPVLSKVK